VTGGGIVTAYGVADGWRWRILQRDMAGDSGGGSLLPGVT